MNSFHPSAASGPWWVLLNPSGSVEDKTIPKFTTEEKSSELFEVEPDGEGPPPVTPRVNSGTFWSLKPLATA